MITDPNNPRYAEYSYRGHDFVMNQDGVYGFWTVSLKTGGTTPSGIQGKFTGIAEAEQAIKAYVNTVEHAKVTDTKKKA